MRVMDTDSNVYDTAVMKVGDTTNDHEKYYNYVLHELLAYNSHLFTQGGTKHHHLLFVRCKSENFLNIASHV